MRTYSFDEAVPVVLCQAGRYPFVYGSLGAIRSLGRAGVTVHAALTSSLAPHSYSRYLDRRFEVGQVHETDVFDKLMRISAALGRPAILLPTDDEAAVYAAMNRNRFEQIFIMPKVAPELSRALASKRDLHALCLKHGVATPRTHFANSAADAISVAGQLGFPLVIKNSEPWSRLFAPAVRSTTILHNHAELLRIVDEWHVASQVVVQEYIPREAAQDWIVHAYCDGGSRSLVSFTGRKYRSWPPEAGVTTLAVAEENEALLAQAMAFCRDVGYCGIADMDWRFDKRDGQYKLVDFNPRVGANFRLFETEDGLDVVRALHLDLTGRSIEPSRQVYGRRFKVENLDWASRLVGRSVASLPSTGRSGVTEYAWFARDDIVPFLVMLFRFSGASLRRIASLCVGKVQQAWGALWRTLGSLRHPGGGSKTSHQGGDPPHVGHTGVPAVETDILAPEPINRVRLFTGDKTRKI